MRQAIVTKYLGATNHRGSRIKATCDAGSLTVAWDHSLGADGNHTAAARALAIKLGWLGTWHGGGTARGYCYVQAYTRNPVACVAEGFTVEG